MTRNSPLTPEEKRRLTAAVPYWWHTIDLGDGVHTPGKIPAGVHQTIASAIPADLTGKTVLDVGAWDGYYSFECERRGARVTAIDNNLHLRGHQGFHTAKRILDSRVTFHEMDLFELPGKMQERFDVVLFLGVLYHLKYPLHALEILSSVCDELLVVESHYIRTLTNDPMMRFYPGTELRDDPTSWWGPNIPCIVDMLKAADFADVQLHTTLSNELDQGRVVLKAYK